MVSIDECDRHKPRRRRRESGHRHCKEAQLACRSRAARYSAEGSERLIRHSCNTTLNSELLILRPPLRVMRIPRWTLSVQSETSQILEHDGHCGRW